MRIELDDDHISYSALIEGICISQEGDVIIKVRVEGSDT